ncbi:MAG: NUDIX hydrolase [Chloroflexi bacterium]|nr:MAG: NUDIX hydrolase [Chloroflexota bacterium]
MTDEHKKISARVKATYPNIREDWSAGGVAYRQLDDGNLEIALIATQRGKRWQLPKGSVEPGELPEEAARREVEEEAGLQTVCEAFLETIDFWYWDTYRKASPLLVHKRVDFYLLRTVGGELSDASYEVDSVGWFTPQHALRQLTFSGEKKVVQKAISLLAARLGR